MKEPKNISFRGVSYFARTENTRAVFCEEIEKIQAGYFQAKQLHIQIFLCSSPVRVRKGKTQDGTFSPLGTTFLQIFRAPHQKLRFCRFWREKTLSITVSRAAKSQTRCTWAHILKIFEALKRDPPWMGLGQTSVGLARPLREFRMPFTHLSVVDAVLLNGRAKQRRRSVMQLPLAAGQLPVRRHRCRSLPLSHDQ